MLSGSQKMAGAAVMPKRCGYCNPDFKNKPPVYYYQGGDTPTLPDELEGMITAELLGPSPKDSGGEFAASDNKTEQYLAALGDNWRARRRSTPAF